MVKGNGHFGNLPATTRTALGLHDTGLCIRPCFLDLHRAMLNHTKIILNGKAGRGKTVFLVWFIFHILLQAKEARRVRKETMSQGSFLSRVQSFIIGDQERSDDPTFNPVIMFCDRAQQKYYITLDSFHADKDEGVVHYYISDNADIMIPAGSILNLAATSGDLGVLPEFSKRLSEGIAGRSLYFPAPDLTDVISIFPRMNTKERQNKFDIVGGNLRVYVSTEACSHKSTLYKSVRSTLDWLFGNELGEDVKSWAIGVIVTKVENASAHPSDNSLFREYTTTKDFVKDEEVFASVALGFIAADLEAAAETNLRAQLETMIGASGMGNLFEYSAHKHFFLGGRRLLVDENLKVVTMDLGSRRKVLIRTVEDIKQLQNSDYGLPIVQNFPLVDAILPPKTVLQMTISLRHGGSVKSVTAIAGALGIPVQSLNMIFVTPTKQLSKFSFNKHLRVCRQYKTTDELVASNDALQSLLGKDAAAFDEGVYSDDEKESSIDVPLSTEDSDAEMDLRTAYLSIKNDGDRKRRASVAGTKKRAKKK